MDSPSTSGRRPHAVVANSAASQQDRLSSGPENNGRYGSNPLTTSFAIAPGRELAALSRIRKGGDNRTTLFVQSISGGVDSRSSPSPPLAAPPEEILAKKARSPIRVDWSAVGEKVVEGATSLVDLVPRVLSVFRSTLMLVFLVLMFLLLCQVVCLSQNLSVLDTAVSAHAQKNSQHVQIASQLTRQLRDISNIIEGGEESFKDDSLQTLLFEKRGIEEARRHSLRVLHRSTAYPGPHDDIVLLVDQHADFEEKMKRIAADEIIWLGTVTRDEHHRLHRKVGRSLSDRHPLCRVSAKAFDLSKKWMQHFYGDEVLTQRRWLAGEEERRRVVSSLGNDLSTSFDGVQLSSSWIPWRGFGRSKQPGYSVRRRGEERSISYRWTLLFLLGVLAFIFFKTA